ncbi:hypothetical protein ABPG75_005021 [Micractinium tetrahymenae]
MPRGAEAAALDWADVRFTRRGVVLFIRQSETDRAGEGQWVFLAAVPDSMLCPVRLLRRWQQVSGGQGPVFKTSTSERRLGKDTMRGRLQRLLAAMGLPSEEFGLHSLRRGRATGGSGRRAAAPEHGARAVAVGCGAPVHVLDGHRAVGSGAGDAAWKVEWRSDVVRQYMYSVAT